AIVRKSVRNSRMTEPEIPWRGGRVEVRAGLVADDAQGGPGDGRAKVRRGFQFKPGGGCRPTNRNLVADPADRKRGPNPDRLDHPRAAGPKQLLGVSANERRGIGNLGSD